MVISGVKRKFPSAIALAFFAGTTALLSWSSIIPAQWVENQYARVLFPPISHIAGYFADAVPFAWLDLWIAVALGALLFSIRRRTWRLPLGLISAGYLMFFWGWGLNYHRLPLETRLGLEGVAEPKKDELTQLTMETAASLNRLWPIAAQEDATLKDPANMARLASDRVRRVIAHIDGKDWSAATRIKHSYLADWWFRIAGIDGVFNPLAHEPVLVGGALDFQLPFLMAHELAHVHGIADEGDANFVAFMAAAESGDPGFQYSAAFEMWLHRSGPSRLLDPGPKRDLDAFVARFMEQEIPQASRLQSAILDSHLRANGVQDGVKSYSRFVALAIATRSRWHEFR